MTTIYTIPGSHPTTFEPVQLPTQSSTRGKSFGPSYERLRPPAPPSIRGPVSRMSASEPTSVTRGPPPVNFSHTLDNGDGSQRSFYYTDTVPPMPEGNTQSGSSPDVPTIDPFPNGIADATGFEEGFICVSEPNSTKATGKSVKTEKTDKTDKKMKTLLDEFKKPVKDVQNGTEVTACEHYKSVNSSLAKFGWTQPISSHVPSTDLDGPAAELRFANSFLEGENARLHRLLDVANVSMRSYAVEIDTLEDQIGTVRFHNENIGKDNEMLSAQLKRVHKQWTESVEEGRAYVYSSKDIKVQSDWSEHGSEYGA